MKILTFLLMLVSACSLRADESAKTAVTNVSAKEAKTILDKSAAEKDASKKTEVVDVRTADEFAKGHIEGAKNIDIGSPTFAEDLGKLDKTKTYVVHCAAGGRSTRSLETFQKLGFKSIFHMNGGYKEWSKEGLPTSTSK